MKWIFGVICITASLAAVSATFCSSEDDCKEGYCCVALTSRQMMNKGLCLRLTKLKRQCSEPESKNDYFGGKFTRYCPCAEGLVCEPSKPGITNPDKRIKALRCKKPSGTTTGPDVTDADETTLGEIVTDGEIVETTSPDVDETLPPEIVTEESEAPEEEVVETEAPEEEVVDEETEAPEEEVVEDETEAPEEEVVEEETESPEEEIVEEETEAPEEVVDENPEEEVPEEAEHQGPGGGHPRTDDPDCEDWTYGCHEPENGPGGERPREDDPDCEDWTYGCHEPENGPGGESPREDDPDCEDWTYGCHEPENGPGGERPREDDPDCEDWTYGC